MLHNAIWLLGGLGVFLYAIKSMGEALQSAVGAEMRRLIAAFTSSPLKGVAVGTLVTMLIQSSSATTVIVVSLVHVGLMTLKQAFGVIMGANIGTTFTGQIVAFKVEQGAPVLIVVGLALQMLSRRKKHAHIGQVMLSLGLLFMGMEMMKDSMSFLKGREDLLLHLSHHPILGVLAGSVLTCLVQSSSATVGLTIAMASQGVLPVEAAVPIIFGDNIGTTVTAVLASLGGNRHAKRAALSHVLFNVIGTAAMLLVLPLYVKLVVLTSSDPARQVANSHTIFNVVNALLFLPFVDRFVALIKRILPGEDEMGPEVGSYLDRRLFDTPVAALEAVKRELLQMGRVALYMFRCAREAYNRNDPKMIAEVNAKEKVLNDMTRGLLRYASELVQGGISPDLSVLATSYIDLAGDVERVGDHCQNLVELFDFKFERNIPFSATAMAELNQMGDAVEEAFRLSLSALELEDKEMASRVVELEDMVDRMQRELRRKHTDRLNRGICALEAGIIFIDILSNLERICDHAHNIARVVLDMHRLEVNL